MHPDSPETPSARIRHARPADAPAIAGLLTILGYSSTAEETGLRLREYTTAVDRAVFVAERQERVLGVLSFFCIPMFHQDGWLGRITSLIVAPEEQRRGIGRLLVAAAEEFAWTAGCGRVEVTSGDHRAGAHAFYERLGYHCDCRRFIKSASTA